MERARTYRGGCGSKETLNLVVVENGSMRLPIMFVAHHVHLGLLGELSLAPEYRIVEQVELVRVELALERHVGTDVDDELLTT